MVMCECALIRIIPTELKQAYNVMETVSNQ